MINHRENINEGSTFLFSLAFYVFLQPMLLLLLKIFHGTIIIITTIIIVVAAVWTSSTL